MHTAAKIYLKCITNNLVGEMEAYDLLQTSDKLLLVVVIHFTSRDVPGPSARYT